MVDASISGSHLLSSGEGGDGDCVVFSSAIMLCNIFKKNRG